MRERRRGKEERGGCVCVCVCVCSYKYTLSELNPMLQAVTLRASSYDVWTARVKDMLEARGDQRTGPLL